MLSRTSVFRSDLKCTKLTPDYFPLIVEVICYFVQASLTTPGLERAYSVESLVSNAESTLTSVSSVRELHQDLDIVQKSHDRITKLEVQLDVSIRGDLL